MIKAAQRLSQAPVTWIASGRTGGHKRSTPDLSALNGYVGATQTISVSNSPITLASPSGFTPTPSGGPTQAQNAVLSFTGTMTFQVTLPLPGVYQIENLTSAASEQSPVAKWLRSGRACRSAFIATAPMFGLPLSVQSDARKYGLA